MQLTLVSSVVSHYLIISLMSRCFSQFFSIPGTWPIPTTPTTTAGTSKEQKYFFVYPQYYNLKLHLVKNRIETQKPFRSKPVKVYICPSIFIYRKHTKKKLEWNNFEKKKLN